MSGLTSAYINNHYRTKLRLHNYGRFSSYLPVVVLPTLVTALFHQQVYCLLLLFVSNLTIIEKPVILKMKNYKHFLVRSN